jgi:ribosomal protein L29
MKAAQLRELTEAELKQLYLETKKELFDLDLKVARGESGAHPHQKRTLRRKIARILTVMKERNIKP